MVELKHQDLPVYDKHDLRIVWFVHYYDGPLNGIAWHLSQFRYYWFDSPDPDDWVYILHPVTHKQFEKVWQDHKVAISSRKEGYKEDSPTSAHPTLCLPTMLGLDDTREFYWDRSPWNSITDVYREICESPPAGLWDAYDSVYTFKEEDETAED